MSDGERDTEYLSVEDILTIHEVIVDSDSQTEAGVPSPGDIDYAVSHISEGPFGHRPQHIHSKAAQLMRLLVANHPFVDGNKRTALASTISFYALNGYDLQYGPEIKDLLKRLATDEGSVDMDDVVEYLEANTMPLPPEYDDTFQLWLSLLDMDGANTTEQNDYADGDTTWE